MQHHWNDKLWSAIRHKDSGGLELALKNGANVEYSNDNLTPLVKACFDGDTESVRILLQHGANPNQTYGGEHSPLIFAASNAHLPVIHLLLDHGADINLIIGNSSPLMAAVEINNTTTIRLLLDSGADVNLSGPDLATALTKAVTRDNMDIVNLLLERGADVNQDYTPLSIAAFTGNARMTVRLLAGGADVSKMNTKGKTPLDIAKERNSAEVAAILERKILSDIINAERDASLADNGRTKSSRSRL